MIKLMCCCEAEFEVDAGPSIEVEQTRLWLDRHQECVKIGVVAHQHAMSIAEKRVIPSPIHWPSGMSMDFCAFDDKVEGAPSYTYVPHGTIKCRECGMTQLSEGEPPIHADDCSNTHPVPNFIKGYK